MKKIKFLKIAFRFFLIFIFLPMPSFAYIDPGSTSYLFQIIIGLVLGGLYLFKSFGLRIFSFLKRPKKNKLTDEKKK